MSTLSLKPAAKTEASTPPVSARRCDVVTLPSGAQVNLLNFNAKACQSIEDAQCIMSVLEEKMIDIEYQLGCHEEGFHPDGAPFSLDRPPPVLWRPRANKAMRWTKLQKAEVQNLMSRITAKDRQSDRLRFLEAFVETAKLALPKDEFERILIATKFNGGTGQ